MHYKRHNRFVFVGLVVPHLIVRSFWKMPMNKPTIIAIASGKGGVGKSLITANLAIALAQAGKKTIAIDMDLGGSNLHSYLGLPNKYPGIGDYLVARHGRLEKFLLPTSIPNLQFIPGDGRTPCMADLEFSEKIRLLLAIRWLRADYILLDLSGGTSHHTLDFFALAPTGLMVTSLEYPSIMNFLVFLRNFIFRAYERELKNYPGVPELLKEFRKVPMDKQMNTQMMVERLAQHHPDAGQKAQEICQRYRPKVIYNFCLTPDQLKICQKVDESTQSLLSLWLEHFGCVFEDRSAREASYRSVPLLPHYPDSLFAQRIRSIAHNILNRWDGFSLDSAQQLREEATRFYQSLSSKP